MILGIGADLADIRRIEATLDRYGERFLRRVFTLTERETSERRRDRAASYARRWAAKEACAKALGTGLSMGVAWAEMGVENLGSGQPAMTLTGGAAARLAALLPPGFEAVVHVTLTDDPPYAQAFVVIEARPRPDEPRGAAAP